MATRKDRENKIIAGLRLELKELTGQNVKFRSKLAEMLPIMHRLKAELDKAVTAREQNELECASYVNELADTKMKLGTMTTKWEMATDRVTHLEIQIARVSQDNFGVSANEKKLEQENKDLTMQLTAAKEAIKLQPSAAEIKQQWTKRLEAWRANLIRRAQSEIEMERNVLTEWCLREDKRKTAHCLHLMRMEVIDFKFIFLLCLSLFLDVCM